MPIATRAFAATAADKPLVPYSFERRDPGPDDVLIDIKYCGICHSDLHMARSETGPASYPLVPGHEIAGVVKAVGSNVVRFKEGDRVGVGCMVDSCRECSSCREGLEQYCVPGFTGTYGAKDRKGGTAETITQGGYSDHITVDQHFVVTIPDSLPLDVAAPLLCAGVTTYSPLKEWKVGPGSKVAVIGLGGLGSIKISNSTDFDCKRFAHVRHAMSLYESRSKYTPRRYEDPHFTAEEQPWRSYDQRWFRGVHSDVGGSYARDGLSNITLAWMVDEAAAHGLRVDKSRLQPGDPLTAMHDQAYDCPYWVWTGLNARGRETSDFIDPTARPVDGAVPASSRFMLNRPRRSSARFSRRAMMP